MPVSGKINALKVICYIFIVALIAVYVYISYRYTEEWSVSEMNSTEILSVTIVDNSIEVLFNVDVNNDFDCILYGYNCNGNDICLDFFKELKEGHSYQMIGRSFSRKYCEYCFKDEILCKTDFYYKALVTFIIIYTACSLVFGFIICKMCVCVSDCNKPLNDGYASESSSSSRSNNSDPDTAQSPTRGRLYWGHNWGRNRGRNWGRNRRIKQTKVVPINEGEQCEESEDNLSRV